MKVKLHKIKCKRCGHRWMPRHEDVTICPKCKSALWFKKNDKKVSK